MNKSLTTDIRSDEEITQELKAFEEHYKSTKKDILSAYKQLESKYKKVDDNRSVAVRKKNQEMVEVASNTSAEDIVKNLAELRLNTNQTISNIEESILDKKAELENLNTAIKVQKDELESVHGIVHKADTLAILLQATTEEKESHAAEMTASIAEKEKSIFELERQHVEMVKAFEKESKRKKEEFDYEFGLKKARQQDELNDEREAMKRVIAQNKQESDVALAEREAAVTSNEELLERLTREVAEFPEKTKSAIAIAVDDATKRADKANGFQVRALETQIANTGAITTTEKDALNQRIEVLTEENTHLRKQLEQANEKVVKVASEAISGAQQRIMPVAAVQATGTSGK